MKKIVTICLSTILGFASLAHAQNYTTVSSLFNVETSVKPGMYTIQGGRLKSATGYSLGNLWVSENIVGGYNVSVNVVEQAHPTKNLSTLNYCTASTKSTTFVAAFNPYSNYAELKCGRYDARINVNPEPNLFHTSNLKAIVGVELYVPGENIPKYILVGKGEIYIPVFDEKDRKTALEHVVEVKKQPRNPSLSKGLYISRDDIETHYKFGTTQIAQDKDGQRFMVKVTDVHTSGVIVHNPQGLQSLKLNITRDVHDLKRNVDEETLCGIVINNVDLSKTIKFDCGESAGYEGQITVKAPKNNEKRRVVGVELFKRDSEVPEYVVLSPIDYDKGNVESKSSSSVYEHYMPYN